MLGDFRENTKLLRYNAGQDTARPYKPQLKWHMLTFFIYLHISAFCAIYYLSTGTKWQTYIWLAALHLISMQGVSVGTHRLWSHRTFKAKLPLEILLAFYQTLTFQGHIYGWARDHRLHHKYADTEFDPHNASRGLFYSHIGWLMLTKSPQLVEKGKQVDMSDLESNPIVMFQKKYYWYFALIIAFLFPTAVPWYFWNESFKVSWYVCGMFRFFLSFHATCLVNSAAHKWGYKPYDKKIRARDGKIVTFLSLGEGFHNFHHAFPWDYKTGEMGFYYNNWSTAFIDLMAKIGWAYNMKSAPLEMIEKRVKKTGDGTSRIVGREREDTNVPSCPIESE